MAAIYAIHIYIQVLSFMYVNIYACSGGAGETTTIAGDDSGSGSTEKKENDGSGTSSKGSESDDPDGDDPKHSGDGPDSSNGGQGVTVFTDTYPTDQKCKLNTDKCDGHYIYLNAYYNNTCVKGDSGDKGRRPWCSDHQDEKHNHIGKKICCDCENWPGQKGDCNAPVQGCPASWVWRKSGCYFFASFKLNYDLATKTCKEKHKDARLLTIDSFEEQRDIKWYLNIHNSNEEYYLGGTNRLNKNEWVWDHSGEPVNKTGFTHWEGGTPRMKENYDCMMLHFGPEFFWSTELCTRKEYFICEMNIK